LGGLTSDSELLPSAETVDNVVASLARSLEGGDYEVDSPNETLFDTLEATSNNLTDISQSYVPSDFENALSSSEAVHNLFNNNLPSSSVANGVLQSLNSHGSSITSSSSSANNSMTMGTASSGEQFLASTTTNALEVTSSDMVTTTSCFEITKGCDSSALATSSTAHNFFMNQEESSLQNVQGLIDAAIGSSSSIIATATTTDNSNSCISTNNTSNNNNSFTSSSFQSLHSTNSSSVDLISSSGASLSVTSSSTSTSNNKTISNSVNSVNTSGSIVVPKSSTTVVTLPSIPSINFKSSSHQAPTSETSSHKSAPVYLATKSAPPRTTATILVSSTITTNGQHGISTTPIFSSAQLQTSSSVTSSGQLAVSLANVGVSSTQILTSAGTGLMTTNQGQNIMIQNASQAQNYITVDQSTLMAAAGMTQTAFGTNLALVATGGTPTYAMLPSGPQILSMAQPQQLQTITKGPNGTYFQTTGGQLMATAASTANASNIVNQVKPKNPPQLLPKPEAAVSLSSGTSTSSQSSTISNSSSNNNNSSNANNNKPVGDNANAAVSSGSSDNGMNMSDSTVVAANHQQQQQVASMQQQIASQVVSSVSGANMTISTGPQQQAYTIGSAAGLGQVMVSQVSGINAVNTQQQTQIAGTIILNQVRILRLLFLIKGH